MSELIEALDAIDDGLRTNDVRSPRLRATLRWLSDLTSGAAAGVLSSTIANTAAWILRSLG